MSKSIATLAASIGLLAAILWFILSALSHWLLTFVDAVPDRMEQVIGVICIPVLTVREQMLIALFGSPFMGIYSGGQEWLALTIEIAAIWVTVAVTAVITLSLRDVIKPGNSCSAHVDE